VHTCELALPIHCNSSRYASFNSLQLIYRLKAIGRTSCIIRYLQRFRAKPTSTVIEKPFINLKVREFFHGRYSTHRDQLQLVDLILQSQLNIFESRGSGPFLYSEIATRCAVPVTIDINTLPRHPLLLNSTLFAYTAPFQA